MREAIAKLDVLGAYEISKDESGASTLAHTRLNKDLPTAFKCIIDKSIGDAEVLFGVLPWFIINMYVKVLKVVFTLRVGLAGHIQDVRDAVFNELSCLECTLERAHEDAIEHFDEADVIDFVVAAAEVKVREAWADNVFLFPAVVLTVLHYVGPVLLLV